MRLLDRLFMDPHQKQLTRPQDYKAPLDVEQVKAEVSAQVKDYETRSLMLAELSGFGPARPLTIAGVVQDGYALSAAMDRNTDGALHQFGVEAKLGASLVTGFLTRRANQLADGIKPGASTLLGSAL